jgi:hypothetical protein
MFNSDGLPVVFRFLWGGHRTRAGVRHIPVEYVILRFVIRDLERGFAEVGPGCDPVHRALTTSKGPGSQNVRIFSSEHSRLDSA